MKKITLLIFALVFFLSGRVEVRAQVPYLTYYQPATVYSPPVAYTPHAVYYSPVVVAPSPVFAIPSPVVAAPVYQPVTRVRSRYRPILGRTVTRVRYGYAPAYYAPAPVVYAY